MTSTSAAPSGRLPLPRVLAFATGSIPVYMLLLVLGTYLTPYYSGVVGIKLAVLGATLSSLRLIDVGLDFALGATMDRVTTPIGRFKPWFALSLPVLAVAIYKLLNPPEGAGLDYLVPWLLLAYAGYSLIGLSHAAWAANIAGAYQERTRIFGWTQGVAVTGSVALLLLPILTHGAIKPGTAEAMPKLAWLLIGVAAVAIPINLIFTPERVVRDIKKEPASLRDMAAVFTTGSMFRLVLADLLLTLGANTTAPMYIFFFHSAKGFPIAEVSLLLIPYIGAGVIGSPTWAHVAKRFGKHRTVQIACVAYAITQTILMIIPKGLFGWTAVGMFAVGFSASAFIPLIRAMVGDVTDQIRLETGKERAGVLYSLVILTQKFGTSVTAIIVLPILQWVEFNPKPNAVNTPDAIFGLEMCYLFAPVIFVLIGALPFFGYKLTAQRHSEIREALEAQEAASLAAAEDSFAGPGEVPPRVAPAR